MTPSRGLVETAWSNPIARRLCVLMGLVGFATENARVVRDTFFISVAGADQIPIGYVVFAVVMVGASLLYAKLLARTSESKLAAGILFASGVVAGGEWLLMRGGSTSVFLAYVVFCSAEMFFLFVPMTVWAVANRSFKVEQGEMYLLEIGSVALGGTVAGALSVRLTAGVVNPYEPLILSAVGFLVAWVFCLKKDFWPEGARELEGDVPEGSTVDVVQDESVWSHAIVRTLVFLAAPMWVLAYMIEFIYYSTLERVFLTPEELSKFLSLYAALCSVVALLVQLYITPWMVRRFGVATTAFGYPVCLAIGAVSTLIFSLFPFETVIPWTISAPLVFVLAARMLDISFYQSVYDSTVHALYYGVSDRVRTVARAVVSGMVFPASIACSGLLLVLLRHLQEPISHVAFSAVAVGFLVVVIAMDIKPDYLRSLLKHTNDTNPRLRATVLGEIGRLSLSESRNIMLDSLSAVSREEALFAARTLAENFDYTLVEDLIDRAPKMRSEVRRELLLQLGADAPPELVLMLDKDGLLAGPLPGLTS